MSMFFPKTLGKNGDIDRKSELLGGILRHADTISCYKGSIQYCIMHARSFPYWNAGTSGIIPHCYFDFHPPPASNFMSTQTNRTTRRRFLSQSGALAATAFALPYLVPGSAFGANEKIHTGHIGVGRQGMGNLKAFLPHAIAVCDVDQKHAAAAQKLVAGKYGKCEVFGDFRKLLEIPGIDAVVVSTPEHWHALPTIAACEAKKDAYCEKPLTLFVAEGRKMVEAARRNNCIVQTAWPASWFVPVGWARSKR